MGGGGTVPASWMVAEADTRALSHGPMTQLVGVMPVTQLFGAARRRAARAARQRIGLDFGERRDAGSSRIAEPTRSRGMQRT